jgi:CHAD domain-containing protein
MRIAAKNLRYTLEIFRAFYGAEIGMAVRASKNIQDVLGDLHEFDVCLDLLEKLTSSHKNDKDFVESVTYLKSKIRSARQQTYRKFVKIWERLEKENVWEELKKAI